MNWLTTTRGTRNNNALGFENMDHLFDDLFSSLPLAGNIARTTQFVPALDVAEDNQAFTITAELPGMTEKDIDISVENNILTIKGEKKYEKDSKDEEGNIHRMERRYGSFTRRFSLPETVNADKAQADFKNGVLTLSLPKVEESKNTKRIQIKSH